MKLTNPLLVLGLALVINPSFGQNFTLLESFEDMDSNSVLDSVVQWNTARTDYFILNSGDPSDSGQVTDGNKALEVQYLDPLSGWGQDFQVVLSPEASATFKQAWESTDPHRWWLFYDITFGSGGGGWANNPIWIGSPSGASYSDQVEVNGGWDQPVTGILEFDAIRNGNELVPFEVDGDRIAIGFGFNGNLTDTSSVWIDNIRLLDTYVAGARPTETLLEGFEDENSWILTPSAYDVLPYTRFDATDEFVTEGEKSARIEIPESGWTTTSTIDLGLSDPMWDLLALHLPEDRFNYILSFDYKIVPDTDVGVNWFQFITQASGVRLTPNGGVGENRTYSINLGTVDWLDTPPNLNMITQGGFDGFVDVYMDNLRLINTQGDTSAPPPPAAKPEFTGATSANNSVTLTFKTEANVTYTILSTTDISSPVSNWTAEDSSVSSHGGSTTWTDNRAPQGARFYLVRRNQ